MRRGPDRGGRGHRRRVRRRAGGLRVGRDQGLPVQDHRGRRGRQHQRHLGVARAAHPVRPARASPAWSTSRSRPSCASGWPARTRPRCARAARSPPPGTCPGPPAPSSGRCIGALTASAHQRPRPGGRRRCRSPGSRPRAATARGGIMLRTTPGDPQSIDIVFLDAPRRRPVPVGAAQARARLRRQEFRRAFPGEIAELTYPARIVDTYAHELLRCVDTSGVARPSSRSSSTRRRHGVPGPADAARPDRRRRPHRQRPARRVGADRDAGPDTGADWSGSASWSPPRAPPSACASTRSASGSRSSTSGARWSATTARCWSCWTWSPRSGAAAGSRCRSRPPGSPSRSAGSTAWRSSGRRPRRHGLSGAAARDEVDLRRRRPRRLRRPRVLPVHRRDRRVRPAARPGRPDQADAERDRRPDPRRAPAQAVHPDAVGGEGHGDADRGRGGRRPGDRHHRRCPGHRAGPAAGSWSCPIPSEAVTHLWAEGDDPDDAAALLDEWAAVVQRADR